MSKLGKKLAAPTSVIHRPHLSEKAAQLSSDPNQPIYTFVVEGTATKAMIKQAVVELYKVKPRRINITRRPTKQIIYRGKLGHKPALKKAVVYLKKGDKIEFI